MAKKSKSTPKQLALVAERLNALCNYSGCRDTSVEVKVYDKCINVVPAPGTNQSALYCVEDITDVCRVFGLSFYVSYSTCEGHIAAHIF